MDKELALFPYYNILNHIMKTTLDIPDELLIEAKAVAARRRTTLKEMVTRSLRREIGLDEPEESASDAWFETGPLGLPVLKKRASTMSPDEYFEKLAAIEEQDSREYARRKLR